MLSSHCTFQKFLLFLLGKLFIINVFDDIFCTFLTFWSPSCIIYSHQNNIIQNICCCIVVGGLSTENSNHCYHIAYCLVFFISSYMQTIHFDVTQMKSIWSIRFHSIHCSLNHLFRSVAFLDFSMCCVLCETFRMPIEFIFHLNDFCICLIATSVAFQSNGKLDENK